MTTSYYKLPPEQIVADIAQSRKPVKAIIQGMEFLIYPHVYPSDKFRTTNFILENIKPFLCGVSLCDMGCGMGIIGLFALQQGAKQVLQADINPLAIENAKANRDLYHYSETQLQIFRSDCFDHIPLQYFDIIVFNIPFHSEPYTILNPLEYAFHDPLFASTRKFLQQVINYCHSKTKIFIAFSNKGNVNELESTFETSNLKWQLWKITNQDQKFDNRLYQLKLP